MVGRPCKCWLQATPETAHQSYEDATPDVKMPAESEMTEDQVETLMQEMLEEWMEKSQATPKELASLAGRLAADNIRVNSVCPGPTETPMLDIFMGRPDQETDREANQAMMEKLTPLGRIGQPEEIANAALFLLSDEASFITGVALPVDGGFVSK